MPLKSKLGTIARGMLPALDRAVETTARAVEADAKGRVPIDTGALQASIEVFGAGGSGERTVEAGQSLDYAPPVEFGTAERAATPFMTPAAEQGRAVFRANVAKEVNGLAGKNRI